MIVYDEKMCKEILRNMLDGFASHDCTFKLNLFTNDIVPDPGDSTAQFTNAVYTGFAGNVSFTWSGPALDENGQWHLLKPAIPASNGETIDVGPLFGYWVWFDDDDGDKVWMAERFDQPITLTPGALLFISPEVILPAITGAAAIAQ